jgi:hypothetical protein
MNIIGVIRQQSRGIFLIANIWYFCVFSCYIERMAEKQKEQGNEGQATRYRERIK